MKPTPLPRILPASDSSILVSFVEGGTIETRKVLSLFVELQKRWDPRIRNLHPAYKSLLIDFDPLHADHAEMAGIVEAALTNASPTPEYFGREISIPVCYDDEFAPDLNVVAEKTDLPADEVVSLHSSAEYVVAFLGFSPGFGYLSGLPERLNVPRRATPRNVVAAGSVGIAGMQTGVYPLQSPGGWQIIGRTPVRMFHQAKNPPTLLQPGDTVRFTPISPAEFANLSQSQEANW
jgi:inhibitor of KinA